MPVRPRIRIAQAGLVAAGLLLTTGVTAANAQVPATSDAASASWQVPDESLDADPGQLAAGVAATEPARVVAVVERHGRPAFDVTDVRGTAQATQVVAAKQAESATLAVSVEEKQQLIPATAAGTGDLGSSQGAPDPYRGSQWALDTLAADAAWGVSRGAGQTVAVVDTGVAPVPDLAGQLLTGWDFVDGHADGRDDANDHGTHVAGIIAAVAGNGIGTAGLAPDARILPVRVLDENGEGYWSDIADGIVYAADNGAGVINLSLSGSAPNSSLETAINYATSRGRVVVAAVGNQASGTTRYPAAYPGVISVAATDSADQVAGFSNYGSYVDLAAPGVGVLSTVRSGYAAFDGTSMAAPYVSAAVALLRSAAVARGLGAVKAQSALEATATDVNATGRDSRSGAGRINPLAALCKIGACGVPAVSAGHAKVTPTLSFRKSRLTVRLNRLAAQQVILQKRVGKKWKRVTLRVSSGEGIATFALKRGVNYRVLIPATSATASAATKPFRRR